MKQVGIIITKKEHWLLRIHKNLLGADSWEDYMRFLRYAPRTEQDLLEEMGKDLSYTEDEEDENITRITFTIKEDKLWADCAELRVNWFKSWREFVVEPMYRDDIEDFVDDFLKSSVVGMNAGITDSGIVVERADEKWDVGSQEE